MLEVARKLLSLFDPRERLRLAQLFMVMAAVALVQTIGIASILPFMSLAANPELVSENQWLGRLYELGGFESTRSFVVFAGFFVLVIMTFTNSAAAIEHWMIYRFVWRKQHRLSVQLLRQYLDEPYTFYLSRNTSELTKNILTEIVEVIQGVLIPGLRLLSQLLVVICVLTLLAYVDAAVALGSVVILGGGYGLIYFAVRRRQRKLGKVRRSMNELRFQTATEALGSIKETKVLGSEEEFLRRFSGVSRRFSDATASNAIVADLPRYGLETLAFGGIVLCAVYLVGARDDFGETVAVMSLYAFAGYRLMPALQHVFRGVAQIRFFLPLLDALSEDLHRSRTGSARLPAAAGSRPDPLRFEREISLENVTYRYPGTDRPVVKEVSLTIPRNSTVAFVGPTGSGKTTLVDLVLGLLEPDDGHVRADDVVLTPESQPSWRQNLGYVPQHIYLCDDNITRNIAFGIADEQVDFEAVQRAARIANLHDFILTLPQGYQTMIGERGVRLSGGQRQRIGIARALYRDPDVLVMDEATSALDGVTEEAVIQALRKLARLKTIILVAHRLTTVRDCDVIYLFDRGEISASGTYTELMHTNLTFRAMARGGAEEVAAV